MRLKTLDLFSGIGGFARGLEATDFFETSCFIENEPYCQAVLRYHWPDIPVLGDIRDVRRPDLPEPDPDVICGGFPCQPFSVAGKQDAQSDSRHLWPEMFRLIRECRPPWVIGENVAGIINLGLDEVLADLEGEGYATRTFNIPACAVGAPHIRQRIWIVAHADSESEPDGAFDGNAGQRQLGFGFVADPDSTGCGEQRGSESAQEEHPTFERGSSAMADPEGIHEPRAEFQGDRSGRSKAASGDGGSHVADPRCDTEGCDTELHGDAAQRSEGKLQSGDGGDIRPEEWWAVEPSMGRLVNGLPNRVPQLRALGNSIVPQIAQEIGNAIKVAEKWNR